MATKTISIRLDVYDMLKSLKREIGEYFGALKDSETLDDIEDDCRKIRAVARHRK